MVPFPVVPGERVRVLYGRVWLTEEGGRRDAFLASGEEVRLDRPGLAVVEALGPARIELIEPLAGPSPLRQAAEQASRWVAGLLRPAPARIS